MVDHFRQSNNAIRETARTSNDYRGVIMSKSCLAAALRQHATSCSNTITMSSIFHWGHINMPNCPSSYFWFSILFPKQILWATQTEMSKYQKKAKQYGSPGSGLVEWWCVTDVPEFHLQTAQYQTKKTTHVVYQLCLHKITNRSMKNIQLSLAHQWYWPVNISHLFHDWSKLMLN